MINHGGEGSPRWQMVEEKGNHEDDTNVDRQRAVKDILAARRQDASAYGNRRRGPLAHDQLAGLSAQPDATERHSPQRILTLCGLYDGRARLLVREEDLLGSEG